MVINCLSCLRLSMVRLLPGYVGIDAETLSSLGEGDSYNLRSYVFVYLYEGPRSSPPILDILIGDISNPERSHRSSLTSSGLKSFGS